MSSPDSDTLPPQVMYIEWEICLKGVFEGCDSKDAPKRGQFTKQRVLFREASFVYLPGHYVQGGINEIPGHCGCP